MAPEVPVAAAPALPIPVPVRGNDDLDPAPSAREWLTGIHSLANNEPPDPPSKAEAWINVQAEPVSENLNPALGDSRAPSTSVDFEPPSLVPAPQYNVVDMPIGDDCPEVPFPRRSMKGQLPASRSKSRPMTPSSMGSNSGRSKRSSLGSVSPPRSSHSQAPSSISKTRGEALLEQAAANLPGELLRSSSPPPSRHSSGRSHSAMHVEALLQQAARNQPARDVSASFPSNKGRAPSSNGSESAVPLPPNLRDASDFHAPTPDDDDDDDDEDDDKDSDKDKDVEGGVSREGDAKEADSSGRGAREKDTATPSPPPMPRSAQPAPRRAGRVPKEASNGDGGGAGGGPPLPSPEGGATHGTGSSSSMTTSEQSGRHRPNTAGASPTPLSESPLPENPDDYYDFTIKRLSMHVSAVPDEDVQQSEHITKKAPNGFNLTDIIKQNMHVHNLGRVTSLTNGDVQVVDVELEESPQPDHEVKAKRRSSKKKSDSKQWKRVSQSSFKWIPGEELSDSEYASKEEEHVFDHNRDSFMLASQYDTDEENDFSSRRVSGIARFGHVTDRLRGVPPRESEHRSSITSLPRDSTVSSAVDSVEAQLKGQAGKVSVLETQPPKEAEDSDYFHRSTMLMQFARKSRRSTDTSSLSASQKRRKKVKSILVTEQKREAKRLAMAKNTSRPPARKHVRFTDPKITKVFQFSPEMFKPSENERHQLYLDMWDRVMLAPLSYELWAFPFRLALGSPRMYSLLFTDLMFDAFHLMDAAIKINTEVVLPNMEEPIRSRSLNFHSFLVNKAPMEFFVCFLMYVANLLQMPIWVWWLFTIPRVTPRAERIFKYFRHMEMRLEVNVRKLQLYKFTLMIYLASHWTGCLFFWLARIYNFNSTTWVSQLDDVLIDYNHETNSAMESYLVCLYKGFNGITNLGYEATVSNNAQEMFFSILVMFFQIIMAAFILGTLFNYLVQKDKVMEEHHEEMANLDEFMKSRALSTDLQERIRRYLEFQFRKQVENKASKSVSLPRSLEIKVANCQYRHAIDKCCANGTLFHDCNEQFLNQVIIKLQEKYLMPGEEFIVKGDIAREICFVMQGKVQVMHGELVLKTVFPDIPEVPNVVGDVAFVMGVVQPSSVRAQLEGDAKLITLSKGDFEEVINNYPEQLEVITSNILTQFQLDKNGNSISAAVEDEPDDLFQETRAAIASALQRNVKDDFARLTFAVNEGDVEEVQAILRRGLDVSRCDYDGRTTLHMAAAQGMYKVVELLLSEGAPLNAVDRWGETPLQVAINAEQAPTVALLTTWKCELAVSDPAGSMCNATTEGDLQMIQRLLENGVDPDSSDYDERTPFHLAAAEGQQRVVEYLLKKGASVNCKDRWGGTPLMDAIQGRHILITRLIQDAGGLLPDNMGASKLCEAASEGDVTLLTLLAECDIDLNVGDYDSRCPLHLAAAEGRLLAVSYLLSISADPNCEDRWGGRPMGDALAGGTLYHMYCARLIHAMGGTPGTYASTEEGQAALKFMESISIHEVREKIKYMIKHKYQRKVLGTEDTQTLEARKRSLVKVLSLGEEYKETLAFIQSEFVQHDAKIRKFTISMQSEMMKMTDTVRMVVDKFNKSRGLVMRLSSIHRLCRQVMVELHASNIATSTFMKGALARNKTVKNKLGNSSLGLWRARAKDIMYEKKASRDIEQLLMASQAEKAESVDDHDAELDDLYNEADAAFNRGTSSSYDIKLLAKGFQRLMLKISDIEEAVSTLQAAADTLLGPKKQASKDSGLDSPMIKATGKTFISLKDMPKLLNYMNINEFQFANVEAMFRACEHHKTTKFIQGFDSPSRNMEIDDERNLDSFMVTIEGLLCCSDKFRTMFMEIEDTKDETLEIIKTGLNLLDNSWQELVIPDSDGYRMTADGKKLLNKDHISVRTIQDLQPLIKGEFGLSVFQKVFQKKLDDKLAMENSNDPMEENPTLDMLSQTEYYTGWLNFLTSDMTRAVQSVTKQKKHHKGRKKGLSVLKSSNGPDLTMSVWSPTVWAAYVRQVIADVRNQYREIQDLFPEDALETYTRLFARVTGDLQIPLEKKDIKLFLQLLSPEFSAKNGINSYEVHEFIRVFKPAHEVNDHGQDIYTYPAIRKVIREHDRGESYVNTKDIFYQGTYVFNPSGTVLQYWHSLMRFSSVFVFFNVPFIIAFQPLQGHDVLGLEEVFSQVLQDILFVCDMLVKFNTGYVNKRSLVVADRAKISRHYLASEFIVDLVGCAPFDNFALILGSDVVTASWLRVPKMLRIRRVWTYLHSKMERNSHTSAVIRLMALAVVILHFCACVWFAIGSAHASHRYTWYSLNDYNQRVHVAAECSPESDEQWRCPQRQQYGINRKPSVWDQYMVSFYWVAATVTTQGLVGNMVPVNLAEAAFSVFIMALNTTVMNYILGEISNIVMAADSKLVKVREELLMVQNFIVSKKLPLDVQEEVKEHFFSQRRGDTVDSNALLSKMGHTLQVAVARQLSREFMNKVALFQGCNENFLDSLSVLLEEARFSPEEHLFHVNEVAREMFLVVQGQLERLVEMNTGDFRQEGIFNKGDTVGDLSFFFGMRHFNSVKAFRGPCTVFFLQRHSFLQLLKLYPEEENTIASNALTTYDKKRSEHQSEGSREDDIVDGGESVAKSAASDFDQIVGVKVADAINMLKTRRAVENVNRFFEFVKAGDENGLIGMVNNRTVGVNVTDRHLRSALHIACAEGRENVVSLLLDAGADVHAKDALGNTPLNDAVQHKRDEVSRILREHQPALKVSMDPVTLGVKMCEAAAVGDVESIRRLLVNGASVDSCDYDKRTPIHLAASNNQLEVLRFLLENNADVNVKDRFGFTPLEDAMRHEHAEAQQILVGRDAYLEGMTLACRLCEHASVGDVDQVKMLMSCGADPNVSDYDQRTAIHLAASNGEVAMLHYLLNIKKPVPVNVNPIDRLGGTPLTDAIRHGQDVAAKMLILRGGMEKGDPALEPIRAAQEAAAKQKLNQSIVPLVDKMLSEASEFGDLELFREVKRNSANNWEEVKQAAQTLFQELKHLNKCNASIEKIVFAIAKGKAVVQEEQTAVGCFDKCVLQLKEVHAACDVVIAKLFCVQEELTDMWNRLIGNKSMPGLYCHNWESDMSHISASITSLKAFAVHVKSFCKRAGLVADANVDYKALDRKLEHRTSTLFPHCYQAALGAGDHSVEAVGNAVALQVFNNMGDDPGLASLAKKI